MQYAERYSLFFVFCLFGKKALYRPIPSDLRAVIPGNFQAAFIPKNFYRRSAKILYIFHAESLNCSCRKSIFSETDPCCFLILMRGKGKRPSHGFNDFYMFRKQFPAAAGKRTRGLCRAYRAVSIPIAGAFFIIGFKHSGVVPF